MIPYRELIKRPERYQPLSSVKSIRNLESAEYYDDVDIVRVFTSVPNRSALVNNLYRIGKNNGINVSYDTLNQLVPKAQAVYLKRNDISKYSTVDTDVHGKRNWEDTKQFINNEFIKFCYALFKWNKFNPYRDYVEVGRSDDRKQVKMSKVTAEQIPTIDVWAIQEVQRSNKNFRYDNQIPIWQRSMNVRNYDKGNDGLHDRDPDRASLDTPIYGYDMSAIHKLTDYWHDTNWFGL